MYRCVGDELSEIECIQSDEWMDANAIYLSLSLSASFAVLTALTCMQLVQFLTVASVIFHKLSLVGIVDAKVGPLFVSHSLQIIGCEWNGKRHKLTKCLTHWLPQYAYALISKSINVSTMTPAVLDSMRCAHLRVGTEHCVSEQRDGRWIIWQMVGVVVALMVRLNYLIK